MNKKELFNNIKSKYGGVGSCAIWEKIDINKKPTYGIGNISLFEDDKTIERFNPDIVFVGLNISKKIEEPFANFHSKSVRANDFKLRYAIQDTCLEGAYMTDIIKDFEEKISGKVISYLRKNPEFLKSNLLSFKEEID